jgi:hypothetical protein
MDIIFTLLLLALLLKNSKDVITHEKQQDVEVKKERIDLKNIILVEQHAEGYFAYRFTDYAYIQYDKDLNNLLEKLWQKTNFLQIVVKDNPVLEQRMLDIMSLLEQGTDLYSIQVKK